jgi:hypothetical protein
LWFKTSTLWLVYHLVYHVTWPDDTDPAINKRQATKLLLLTAINAADEKKAFKGFRSQSDKGGPEKRLTDKILAQVLSALKAKHKPIADKIASGAGIDLMFLDCAITESIISYFTNKGIPILTVHDIYVVVCVTQHRRPIRPHCATCA